MTTKEKKYLKEYLYPTQEAKNFIIGEINPLLTQLLPKELCISDANLNHKVRKLNYQRAYLRICEFLFANEKIVDTLERIWSINTTNHFELKELVDDMIVNYVFCLTQAHEEYKKIDIFKNKRSICFRDISILDVLDED